MNVISFQTGAPGDPITKGGPYDTYGSRTTANAGFAAFLSAVPAGHFVMASAQDYAGGINTALLKDFGGSGAALNSRTPFALIGKKGMASGTAQEKQGCSNTACVRLVSWLPNFSTPENSCDCTSSYIGK
jgi:hypothetical protein